MVVAAFNNPAAGADFPPEALPLSGTPGGLASRLADFGERFRAGPCLILKIKNIAKNNVKNIEVYIKYFS
jgi:hypothetical protein